MTMRLQRDVELIRTSPILQIVERTLASVLTLSLLTLLVGDYLLGLPFGARGVVVVLVVAAATGLVVFYVVVHVRRRNAGGR